MRGPLIRHACVVALATTAIAGPSARAEDARLAGARGTVEVQVGTGAWAPATAGSTVAAGARVAARDEAQAQLAFGDAGRLDLRRGTVIVLGQRAVRATVERGTIEQELGDGRTAVRLLTPAAQVEQRGGSAVVAVDADGVTRVANLGGGTVKVRAAKAGKATGRTVAITTGAGIRISPGRAPDAPHPLPPAPRWTATSARAVAVAGHIAPIMPDFAPSPGLTAYHVTIRTTGGDRIATLSATGGPETGRVAIEQLPPGAYAARIATIDADGFESKPSGELPIEVFELPAVAPGRDDLVGLSTEPSAVPMLVVGTRLMVPAALSCRLDDEPARSPLVVTRTGAMRLSCQQGGEDVAGLAIVGAPLALELAERAGPLVLPRDGTITLAFTLRDPADAPAVDAVASGLRVVAVDHAAPGVRVTVGRAGESLAGELELVLRDAPHVTLTRVALAIDEPPTEVVDRPAAVPVLFTGLGVQTGGYLGYLVVPDSVDGALELGNADDPAYRIESGPVVGARVALWPTRRAGLEVELGVIPTGFAGADGRATVLAARGQLGFRIVDPGPRGRLGFGAVIGAGALGLVSASGAAQKDTDSAAHWGLGLSVALPRRLELRLDARHLVGPARDAGYAHLLEIDLGFGARFGD